MPRNDIPHLHDCWLSPFYHTKNPKVRRSTNNCKCAHIIMPGVHCVDVRVASGNVYTNQQSGTSLSRQSEDTTRVSSYPHSLLHQSQWAVPHHCTRFSQQLESADGIGRHAAAPPRLAHCQIFSSSPYSSRLTVGCRGIFVLHLCMPSMPAEAQQKPPEGSRHFPASVFLCIVHREESTGDPKTRRQLTVRLVLLLLWMCVVFL